MNHYSRFLSIKSVLKRIFDFSISFFSLILLSPLFIIISTVVFLYDGHSPIVLNKAVGQGGKIFSYPLFRTFRVPDCECINCEKENDEEQMTYVGHLISSLSLVKLPALICILLGDMSLVGPKPLLYNEYEKINSRFSCGAYKVKPGLTGLAQIYDEEDNKKNCHLTLDGLYAAGWSLSLDAQILGVTLKKMWNS